jgi:hypothetical protein
MDVRIEHEVSGRTIRAEVYGIAPGTSLHRVRDALRAVREGMSVPKVEEPAVHSLTAGWHKETDQKRIKDLESHIVGMQVKAESDAKLIKQQVDQIKALRDALHGQLSWGCLSD